jgi:hypothetical protein
MVPPVPMPVTNCAMRPRVCPQLRARGLVVRVGVRGVVVLVHEHRARAFRRDALGHAVVAVRMLGSDRGRAGGPGAERLKRLTFSLETLSGMQNAAR